MYVLVLEARNENWKGFFQLPTSKREVYLMWSDDYRVEQDEMKTPEFLKVKALQRMQDARNSNKSFFKIKPMWSMAFGLVVIIVVALNWTNILERNPELLTDLTFERIDGGTRRFGGIGLVDTNQQETLIEAEDIIGVSISDLYLEGFYLGDVSWILDKDDVRIQYLFEQNGSSIQIMLNNHVDSVTTNSIFNDLPLALHYQIMLVETTFYAEFLYNEIYYQIEATGLTKGEFTRYLEEILAFLN